MLTLGGTLMPANSRSKAMSLLLVVAW